MRDSRANVVRFVSQNLASGADHMFVFLEGDDEETYGYLLDHPHVTAAVTDDSYWGPRRRPGVLTRRQTVNANLVNCLLATTETADWLVHLDGDECLEIDRERIEALGQAVRCVQLPVLEAVSSEHGTRGVAFFKRKLGAAELESLTDRGVIPVPDNRAYLSGHLHGKAAARPGPDIDIGIHRAVLKNGRAIRHRRVPDCSVLHFESASAHEFVRKWTAHISGGATRFRHERRVVIEAVAAVLAQGASEEQVRARLREIFRLHVEDPVDLLRQLDLLVTVRPDAHSYHPRPFSTAKKRDIDRLMSRLLTVDKSRFQPGRRAR